MNLAADSQVGIAPDARNALAFLRRESGRSGLELSRWRPALPSVGSQAQRQDKRRLGGEPMGDGLGRVERDRRRQEVMAGLCDLPADRTGVGRICGRPPGFQLWGSGLGAPDSGIDTAIKMFVGLSNEALPGKGQQCGEQDGDPARATFPLGHLPHGARARTGADYPRPGRRSARAMLASHRHTISLSPPLNRPVSHCSKLMLHCLINQFRRLHPLSTPLQPSLFQIDAEKRTDSYQEANPVSAMTELRRVAADRLRLNCCHSRFQNRASKPVIHSFATCGR